MAAKEKGDTVIRLGKVILALALIWSLWWAVAGFGLRQSVAGWFDTRAAQGWQAEYAALTLSGFPLRHRLDLRDPVLADPDTGVAWRGDALTLQSSAIRPGRQTLTLPETPQRVSYFDATALVLAQAAQAELHLKPAQDLQLQQMGLQSAAWRVEQDGAAVMSASALRATMVQGQSDTLYQIDVAAPGFQPGAGWRDAVRALPDLPATFDTLSMDMAVTFSQPWDLGALDARPQPRRIALKRAEAQWGVLRILMAGTVVIDPNGVPTGSVSLKADNWRDILALAAAGGLAPPAVLRSTERVLSVLAGLSGNRASLDVTIEIEGGQMMVGFVPLGPAPRLILR